MLDSTIDEMSSGERCRCSVRRGRRRVHAVHRTCAKQKVNDISGKPCVRKHFDAGGRNQTCRRHIAPESKLLTRKGLGDTNVFSTRRPWKRRAGEAQTVLPNARPDKIRGARKTVRGRGGGRPAALGLVGAVQLTNISESRSGA